MLPPPAGEDLPPELNAAAAIGETTTVPRPRRRRRGKQTLPHCFRRPSTGALNMMNEQEDDADVPLFQQVVRAQTTSPEYQATRQRWHRLRTGEEAADTTWRRTLRDEYTVDNDLISYTKDGARALVVPLELWPRVIHDFHDAPTAAHPGRDETILAVRELYYWPAMAKQIQTHVRHCEICASTKRGGAAQPHAPLRPRPPTRPWQAVSIDIMSPYHESRIHKNHLLITLPLRICFLNGRKSGRSRAQQGAFLPIS
ncbi:hypothetical protein NQ318_007501 [Aromia moschata]|uniref:RNA-directed DNA polymerase n=1 Tax=Aromia moschata TaxID=1265417 RepID=A0AAV8YEP5_9CUCU|nr:hypothetical protein NQ318_007501 [Aromia moschata]